MARDEKDHIPTWDGSATNWEDFETDVELYVDGTPTKDRCTCGPRVARKLTGRVRTATLGMTRQDQGCGWPSPPSTVPLCRSPHAVRRNQAEADRKVKRRRRVQRKESPGFYYNYVLLTSE